MSVDWTERQDDVNPVVPSEVNRLVRSMGEQMKILRAEVLTPGVNRVPHGLEPRYPSSVMVQPTGSWDAIYDISFDGRYITCTSTYGSTVDMWVAY